MPMGYGPPPPPGRFGPPPPPPQGYMGTPPPGRNGPPPPSSVSTFINIRDYHHPKTPQPCEDHGRLHCHHPHPHLPTFLFISFLFIFPSCFVLFDFLPVYLTSVQLCLQVVFLEVLHDLSMFLYV